VNKCKLEVTCHIVLPWRRRGRLVRFTLRLPLKRYGRIIRADASKFWTLCKVTMAKILLAEDDEDLRGFLVRALEKAGHELVAFGDGAGAYEELKNDHFDLLLTDIVMPEMDGIELARRAAELDPTLKIMFITGFAAVALNPDNKAPKDAKILSKPFHLRDLVQEVEKMMAA
jgi:two-component system cell cycle response regulator CpdR